MCVRTRTRTHTRCSCVRIFTFVCVADVFVFFYCSKPIEPIYMDSLHRSTTLYYLYINIERAPDIVVVANVCQAIRTLYCIFYDLRFIIIFCFDL